MAVIGKASTQTVFFAVIGYVLQYSFNIYLARMLPASDYGDFAVAISMLFVLALCVEIGASISIPKYIHFYQKDNDLPRIAGLLRGFIIATILFSFLAALLGSGLGYLDLEITHKAHNDQLHPLLLALWFLPFIAISNILAASLKCINPRINSELPRLTLYGVTFLFFWLFIFVGFKGSDWSAVALFGVANILVFAVYLFLAVRYVPRTYVNTTPKYEWREWLTTALPIMMSSVLFMGTRQADLYMVEALGPNEESVGYFSAVIQTTQGLIIIYTALNVIYGSRIGKAIVEGKEVVKEVLQKMVVFLSCFCLLFLLFFIFFGKSILGLFGEDYLQAYPTMLLSTIGTSVRIITGGYITFLLYSGKQKQVLAVQFAILALSIILDTVLIPRFGILGAGISSAICFVVMSAFFTYRALRLLRTGKNNQSIIQK